MTPEEVVARAKDPAATVGFQIVFAAVALGAGLLTFTCNPDHPWVAVSLTISIEVSMWACAGCPFPRRLGGAVKTIVSQIILALYAFAVATACLYVPWLGSLARVRG